MTQQLPLFPDPSDHQAFVRVVLLPWPLQGCGYSTVCPGCPESSGAIFGDFEVAREQALTHRLNEGAWTPPEEPVFGPVAKWPTAP